MWMRICFGGLLVTSIGLSQPLPKVAESDKPKPKRFTISRNQSTVPRTIMEVPSIEVGEAASPQLSPIEVKNKENVVVDNLLFGFMTLEGKPLADEEIKRKARLAVADLWFGKNPGNCWIDEKNILYVEGSPLQIVFVYLEKQKRRDFTVEEENSIRQQFADQVRTILYAPARRTLARRGDQPVYFGILKDDKSIQNNNEELLLQQKVYQVLSGLDVPEFESSQDGTLTWNKKERITIGYYYIESSPGKAESVEFTEPDKTQWNLKERQHVRQILVVERRLEKERQLRVAAFVEKVNEIERVATPPQAPVSDKEARKKTLKEVLNQITEMENAVANVASGEQRAEIVARLNKAKSQAELESEMLLYPIALSIEGTCQNYQLAQVKRNEWKLRYQVAGEGEPKEVVLTTLPLWQKCDGETLVLALDQSWQVYHQGQMVFARQADVATISDVRFRKEKGSPVVRVSSKTSKVIVGEYRVVENEYRMRLLLGAGLEDQYTAYIEEGGVLDMGPLGKFSQVEYESIVSSEKGFLFSARSQKPGINSNNLFVVNDGKVSELPETFQAKKVKQLTWEDKTNSYRAVFQEDEAYFYDISLPNIEITKRLKVSQDCESSYGFKVQADGTIIVEFKGDGSKQGLEIAGLRSVVCSPKAIVFLSTDAKVIDGVVKNEALKREDPDSGRPTLFVVSEDRVLSSFKAPNEFSYTTIEITNDRTQMIAHLSGPTAIFFSFDESGDIVSPVSRGNPNEDVGMWFWPKGKAILWNKGAWQAIFESTNGMEARDRYFSIIGSGLRLREGKQESEENTLFTFDKDVLVGSFASPLAKEGESFEKVALVRADGQWMQRVWLKNNTDYTLLVSLDGKSVTPKRFIPFERLERSE